MFVGFVTNIRYEPGLRENGERMRKWKGNGERMRKWREIYSLHFLIAHLSLSVALSFLVCPAMVTSTLSSAISYFQLYKPYIFWKDITLATSLHHPDLIWRSSYHHMIVGPIRYRPVPGIFLLFLILPQTNISCTFLSFSSSPQKKCTFLLQYI